jgi:membrane-bound lytic murein transglycosylase B
MPASLSRLIVVLAVACACAVLPAVLDAQDPVASSPSPSVPFSDWLAQLRKEALAKGISERTVEATLTNVEPLPVVVERDRTQAERTLSIDKYLQRRVDRKTVKTAREMAKRHVALLGKVSAQFGVPANVIVAVWGLESNFGRFSGVRPIVVALATLAYDNRRAAMFKEELFNALRILDRGDIDLSKMKGSWAVAMGQPQFMPSSYLKYAEDFDHDGKRDIWGSESDVFASIANYLKQNGWTTGAGWGRAVSLPKGQAGKLDAAAPLRTVGCEATRQMTEGLALSRWRSLGVRPAGRQTLPKSKAAASLVRAGTRNFLVFDNYAVLLQYNCAHAYALAVGLLADSIPAPAARAK